MANFHNHNKVSFFDKNDKKFKIGGYLKSVLRSDDKIRKGDDHSHKKFPAKVDLRPFMTPVEQQGEIGSCTANSMAGAYEYLAKRHLGDDAGDVSRLFIYYNAREKDGTLSEDAGSTIRTCIEVLQEHGACSEGTWAYNENKFKQKPSENAYNEARNFLIEDTERIENDLHAWKSCLAEGYPIAFGIEIFESMQQTKRNGRIPIPDTDTEEHLGGHAMLCVGYIEADKVFIVRNSWGEEWGDKGYCYMPYDYLLNEDFNDGDNWIIKNITDLDFSQGVVSDDEESYFYEDGTLVIYDFYIVSTKTEAFLAKVEALTTKYAIDDDWNFEYSEDDEGYLYVDDFYVVTEDAEGFLDELNVISSKYAVDDDYDFQYEIVGEEIADDEIAGEEGQEDEITDEKTEDETNEEIDESLLELFEFHIVTKKPAEFFEKLEALCDKFANEDGYDYEEEEDAAEQVCWVHDFYIYSDEPDKFLENLEKLCSRLALNDDYHYEILGEEEEE